MTMNRRELKEYYKDRIPDPDELIDATLNLKDDGFAIDHASGNVGIGTTEPVAKLDVKGDTTISGTLNFRGARCQTINLHDDRYAIGVQSNTQYFRTHENFAWYKGGTHSDATLDAGTDGRVQMVILEDGNVGIGTKAPDAKLHVLGNTLFEGRVGIGTSKPEEELHIEGGKIQVGSTNDVHSTVGRNDLVFNRDDGHSYISQAGAGNIVFTVGAPGGSGGQTPLTVHGNGNVGVGIRHPSATLEVAEGKTTLADAWTERSSVRFKENIRDIDRPLAVVQQLRGVFFDWRDSHHSSLGLIAEEAGKVLPELVTYEANGKDAKGLDYGRLTALLVEAVKAQQEEIEELKTRLPGSY